MSTDAQPEWGPDMSLFHSTLVPITVREACSRAERLWVEILGNAVAEEERTGNREVDALREKYRRYLRIVADPTAPTEPTGAHDPWFRLWELDPPTSRPSRELFAELTMILGILQHAIYAAKTSGVRRAAVPTLPPF